MAKKPTEMSGVEENAEIKKPVSKKSITKKVSPKKIKIKETTAKIAAPKKLTAKEITSKKIVPKKTKVKTVKAKKALVEEEMLETHQEDLAPELIETNSQSEFLSNFNWHNYKEGIDVIEDKQLDEFEKLVKDNFVDTADDDVIEGIVTYMTDREAIIDINAKSEGVISLNEFRYNPDLKIGDKVEVIVDMREDKTGQLVLSHRKARVIKAWDRVNNAHDNSEIVSGFVKCRTKGGMIVDVFGIEAFLPGSQIDVKPIRDYDQYVNKTMEFKVVKINH